MRMRREEWWWWWWWWKRRRRRRVVHITPSRYYHPVQVVLLPPYLITDVITVINPVEDAIHDIGELGIQYFGLGNPIPR